MRKYILHILIISFVFLLAPTVQVASYAGEMEFYKEKVRENPDDAEAHFGLGYAYGDAANWREAIASFKQAIKLDPDNDAMGALAHFGLCGAYFNLGMYKEAIESGKQSIRIDPDVALVHYGLGLAYLGLNNKSSALDQYEILKKLDTELANGLFNLIYE